MVDREWHWEQGTKYALEAIKALLVINGGAAVALLAFAGQISKTGSDPARIASQLGNSLLGFGIGALAAQLQYGNFGENDRRAHYWHRATYALVAISIVVFVIGLWFAREALTHSRLRAATAPALLRQRPARPDARRRLAPHRHLYARRTSGVRPLCAARIDP